MGIFVGAKILGTAMKVEDTAIDKVHGWGCTPTEETPAAPPSTANTCLPPWVTRGWRRNTLFCILVFLMILVFLNIALTLWIISTLRLTRDGIGPVTIIKQGIRLSGQAWVEDGLVASAIASPPALPITMHAHRNFTVLVKDPEHSEHAKLHIRRDAIECSGRTFEVRDAAGGRVFQAASDEVRVFADALAVDGAGGVNVRNSLQAPLVRAPPGSDLQLESLTRMLDLRAPQSIYFESRAGNIDIASHNNIKLDSVVGAIKIDAPNIIISNLKEATTVDKPQKSIRGKKVYQMCACASGKLFLAAPDALCAMQDNDTELCR
ncbi:delta-sarcoglycan-like isoform X2 [Aricia agestis]|uniref:delta-sarcoglycan-like isoform X2 n=1 Tax=Aricia agestis TaxID=91739 RepID=UPI001C203467|nr:delta-sarcoglycan-like isoform X2 [Aricia agestis]